MSVYIVSTGAFLPGPPIDNDNIERVLGYVDGKPSRLRHRILKANGIKTRHFAINDQQETLYRCDQLSIEAARVCLDQSHVDAVAVTMLSVASSQGDLLLPGLASMVQAGLELSALEIHTAHGICSSSLMALKTAANSITLGQHDNALVVSTELSSRLLKKSRYEAVREAGKSVVDFNAEFLRWMLSDGAGALLLSHRVAPRGVSLKIDWIRSFSHADSYPLCMTVGWSGDKTAFKTWQDYETYAEAEADGAIQIRQDVRLLENIVKLGVDGMLRLIEEGVVNVDKIDHFLCHYSSHHFRGKIVDMLTRAGAMIPEEKWYTNLYSRGNTGCAAMFIMIDEFLKTQTVKPGQIIFCHVPESGRFNTAYMQLTVQESP